MADRLATFALGSLHAAVLILALVLLSESRGIDPFSGLSTALGLAIYAWLWALSWGAAHMALRDADLAAPGVRLLAPAAIWGGMAGAAFVLGATLVAAVGFGDPLTLVFGLFAAAFAFGVGALVGGLLALLDLGIARLAARAEGPARAPVQPPLP